MHSVAVLLYGPCSDVVVGGVVVVWARTKIHLEAGRRRVHSGTVHRNIAEMLHNAPMHPNVRAMQLLTAYLASRNLPLTTVDEILEDDALMLLQYFPMKSGKQLRRTYLADAYAAMMENVKKLIGADPFCIVTDGSTKNFGGLSKDVFVVIVRTLSQSALVEVACVEHSTAEHLKEMVVQALGKHQLALENCVGVMADNATSMNKLARLMDMPRYRCLAHALHLVVKDIIMGLPPVEELITVIQTFLSFGLQAQRRKRVALATNKPIGAFDVASTRWGSCLKVVRNLDGCWDAFRKAVADEKRESATKTRLLSLLDSPVCRVLCKHVVENTGVLAALITRSQADACFMEDVLQMARAIYSRHLVRCI